MSADAKIWCEDDFAGVDDVRHVCVVVTARPSYSRIRSVLLALQARPDVRLTVVAAASALLERYGRVVAQMRLDGFDPIEVCSVIEGDTTETAACGMGLLTIKLSSLFALLRPDLVVTIADRHETLATAVAAAYLHCPLCHIQGGERSGSIDEKVRHAVTQLADSHLVATTAAGAYVAQIRPGAAVTVTGCPSIDIAREALALLPLETITAGVGGPLPVSRQLVVLLQHPVTGEADEAGAQMRITLEALAGLGGPVLALWPGQDAGAGEASKVLREASLASPGGVYTRSGECRRVSSSGCSRKWGVWWGIPPSGFGSVAIWASRW